MSFNEELESYINQSHIQPEQLIDDQSWHFLSSFTNYIHEKLSAYMVATKSISINASKSEPPINPSTKHKTQFTDSSVNAVINKALEDKLQQGTSNRNPNIRMKPSARFLPKEKQKHSAGSQKFRQNRKQTEKSATTFTSCNSPSPCVPMYGNSPEYNISCSKEFPVLSPITSRQNDKAVKSTPQKCRRIKPTLVSVDASKGDASNFDRSVSCAGKNFQKSEIKVGVEKKLESLLNNRLSTLHVSGKELEVEHHKIANKTTKPLTASPADSTRLSADCLEKLDRLAKLHTYLIEKFLFSNIIEEIQMLVMVVLSESDNQHEAFQDQSPNLLSSLLNTVEKAKHFASTSFVNLSVIGFFQLFTTDTLNLLLVHISEKSNVSSLLTAIQKELDSRSLKRNSESISNPTLTRTSVPFKLDTDNRSNFHSDKAFSSFRKQRDMFYALLRHWDSNKLQENATKEVVGQIRWLINQVKTQSTFDAFLRLFVDHLLNIGGSNDDLRASDDSPLVSLLNGDAAKLRRLEDRVTKASPTQKGSSCDWMYREFQFFRDFIAISDSYTLNVRLCDVIQSRIVDIENESSQIEDDDDMTVEQIDSVIQAMKNLRILGNFYGHVIFTPHQEEAKRTRLSHMEESGGGFVAASIKRALNNGHLLLTIPWVVQFLFFSAALLSSTALFRDIAATLHSVYRLKATSSQKFPVSLSLFLASVITALTEQDFFSDEIIRENLTSPVCLEYKLPAVSLDSAADKLLTCSVISEMQWRLADVKWSLKHKQTAPGTRPMPKKIKPSTEKLPETSNVQAKLEAAFFKNQPNSLKRTVLFVADRTHSNCVKHLCSDVLPQFCRENEQLQRFCEDTEGVKDNSTIREMANELHPVAIEYLWKKAKSFVADNVTRAMDVLVSSTVSPAVLKAASDVTERTSLKNVETWLRNRLFVHLVSNVKVVSSTKQKKPDIDGSVPFPPDTSRVLHDLRERVIENQAEPDEERVADVIKDQLRVVSELLRAWETSEASLPHHVTAAFSFLVRELICTSPDLESNQSRPFLCQIDIADDHRDILLNLLDTHS